MAETKVVMGIFEEIDDAAVALDRVRELGINDREIEILSSLPLHSTVLGRPHVHTVLPRVTFFGAIAGFLIGIFFVVVTPYLYIIRVGGQPIVPIPPTAVLLYEFTMLGIILATFFGMVLLNEPTYKPQYYYPEITDGRIGLIVSVPDAQAGELRATLSAAGAETAFEPERRPL